MNPTMFQAFLALAAESVSKTVVRLEKHPGIVTNSNPLNLRMLYWNIPTYMHFY